jgi:hypothetical protein
MTTGRFRAGVQYGDWKGTAAADDADGAYDLASVLEAKGLFDHKTQFLVAAEIYVAENQGGKAEAPFIHAFIIDDDDDAATLTDKLKNRRDPIEVRHVEVELSIEELIGCFKRFSVVLTHRALGLEDREYQYDD